MSRDSSSAVNLERKIFAQWISRVDSSFQDWIEVEKDRRKEKSFSWRKAWDFSFIEAPSRESNLSSIRLRRERIWLMCLLERYLERKPEIFSNKSINRIIVGIERVSAEIEVVE